MNENTHRVLIAGLNATAAVFAAKIIIQQGLKLQRQAAICEELCAVNVILARHVRTEDAPAILTDLQFHDIIKNQK